MESHNKDLWKGFNFPRFHRIWIWQTWLDVMFMQYFQSEMKLNRASYILSYFFSKGSLVFASNKSISYKIDSFITYSNCEKWRCLLTSAGKVSRAQERERQWQEIAPSISFPPPINTVEIAYQNEEKQQGATDHTSHLHQGETFENLLHVALGRRTLSWILHFKIWTMI